MSQPIDKLTFSAAREDLVAQANAYYDADEFDKARAITDELLVVAPQDYSVLHLAGVIAYAQDRLPDASELLKLALKHAPDAGRAALSWYAIGRALRKAGDLRQAEEALRRAVRLEPYECSYMLELADTYMAGWKIDLAMETITIAMHRLPTDHRPRLVLGGILHKSGRYEDARIAYELAIELKPDDASAHMSMGSTLKVLGRFKEAKEEMRKALQLDPMIRGYMELTQLANYEMDEAELDAIKNRLDPAKKAPLPAQVDALFALAKIYDDRGDYATGFKYLDEGCRLYRPTLQYSIFEQERMVDGIIALFTPDFIARYEHMSTSELAPIFIVGMPRSGTTLTEQIIASHSRVRPGGELPFITMIARELGQTWEDRGSEAPGDDTTVANDLNQAAVRYGELTADLWKGSPHITDKMPMNFFYVGVIHFLFPKAKIIYCRRNPAATCFSNLQNLFSPGNIQFSYDQVEIGRFYKFHERIMKHWSKVLPGHIYTVDYEELVQDHENQVHRLLGFCGLEFEPACLDFHTLKRAVPTASFAQVRKPIYTSSLDHWRNYEPYLGPLLETLGMKTAQADPA